MDTNGAAKRMTLYSYLGRSFVLLLAIFLVSYFLLTTVLKPYLWMPISTGMPTRLSGGGAPPRGDCAALFQAYRESVRPPLLGKPIDCITGPYRDRNVLYVQMEDGIVVTHSEFEVDKDGFELAFAIMTLCGAILWVILVRRIKRAAAHVP